MSGNKGFGRCAVSDPDTADVSQLCHHSSMQQQYSSAKASLGLLLAHRYCSPGSLMTKASRRRALQCSPSTKMQNCSFNFASPSSACTSLRQSGKTKQKKPQREKNICEDSMFPLHTCYTLSTEKQVLPVK